MSISPFFALFSGVLGLTAGSFVLAWVERTAQKKPFVFARSQCSSCGATLGLLDLIPFASYLLSLGRCRYCNDSISLIYPTVEVIVAVLFISTAIVTTPRYGIEVTVLMWIETIFLVAVFISDLQYGEIWDRHTTIPALALVPLLLFYHISTWETLLLGAGVGGGFFLFQFLISRGRWIGGGDVRLGILLGVILGLPNVIIAIMLAYVIGAIGSLPLLMLNKKKLASTVPFGTYLTVAAFVILLWGNEIIHWYMSLVKF